MGKSLIALSILLLNLAAFTAFSAPRRGPAGPPPPPRLAPNPQLGLAVASDFTVTRFADNDLAGDIRCLAVDSYGRIVAGGPSFIRVFFDRDTNGVAEGAVDFARPNGIVNGLCFDGPTLFSVGSEALWRYQDMNGDGVADEEAEKLFNLPTGELGAHGLRKGPDGFLYVTIGSEALITRKTTTVLNSPIHEAEGGVIMRFNPSGTDSEVVAQGFYRPYHCDFNWCGDLFTFDAEYEPDHLLPWHAPPRIYQVGYAGHHGWRPVDAMRGYARPAYYLDTIEPSATVEGALPTGFVAYRHRYFPDRYQQGFFALDWANGRIYFVEAQRSGAGYSVRTEVFLKPFGNAAFAPTDAVVAPDGALYVSTGGHKTRGAIYRIQYTGQQSRAWADYNELLNSTEVGSVVYAPQPLEAWSRAKWVAKAKELGADAFSRILANEEWEVEPRLRAVEVLTEVFGGLAEREVRVAARSRVPELRARVAWSLGRKPTANFAGDLFAFANDADAGVRRCALEALGDRILEIDARQLAVVAGANLGHPDKRVRLAAVRLATLLPANLWENLAAALKSPSLAQSGGMLAALQRSPLFGVNTNALGPALGAWRTGPNDPQLRIDLARLITLALGDYRIEKPTAPAFAPFETAFGLDDFQDWAQRLRDGLSPGVPSHSAVQDLETTRVLAMIQDDHSNTVRRVAGLMNTQTEPAADFHYLAVLAKLRGPRSAEVTKQTARAFAGLDRKLPPLQQTDRGNWDACLTELLAQLTARDLALIDALFQQPDFAREGNVPWMLKLAPELQPRAAALLLRAVNRQPSLLWPSSLIELLSLLPPEQAQPEFRRQWQANPALRDPLTVRLAASPKKEDAEKFLQGLDAASIDVVEASVAALLQLPPAYTPDRWAHAFRLLRRLAEDPAQQALRSKVLSLVNHITKRNFAVKEDGLSESELVARYQPIINWYLQNYPSTAPALMRDAAALEWDRWKKTLAAVDWKKGDARRGQAIFIQRGCAVCHDSPDQSGPTLWGVTKKYSTNEVFHQTIFPDLDMKPPYATTELRTRNAVVTGLVTFENRELFIVQIGPGEAIRLDRAEVLSRQPGKRSLMPSGTLNGLTPAQLADLYAFLSLLQPPS